MSSLDQQIPHHISNLIVFLFTPDSKDIYKKKIILQIWLVLYFSVEHERLIFMFTCLARYMGNICNRKKFVEFCLQYKFSSQSCVAKPAVILLIITIHLLLFIKALDILKSIKWWPHTFQKSGDDAVNIQLRVRHFRLAWRHSLPKGAYADLHQNCAC